MKQKIKQHFKKNDRVIYQYLVTAKNLPVLETAAPQSYFYRLIREIAFQQLSGKAGSTIFSRFENLFNGKQPTPAAVVKKSHETLRSSGLSNAKASYIRNIAEAAVNKKLVFEKLPSMNDDAVIETLVQIKGIGRWTAEMFLIFTLGRENVFSTGDLGLKKGMIKLYGLKKEPNLKQIIKITEKWSPYKTYGSLVLWHVNDNEAKKYISETRN